MLTDEGLVLERRNKVGGLQRIYRWGDWGLSVVNSPMAHPYPFAWEVAVMKYDKKHPKGCLDYTTPLTTDVEVFSTDQETDAFIVKAQRYFTLEV